MTNPLIVPVKILRGHEMADYRGVLDVAFHPTQVAGWALAARSLPLQSRRCRALGAAGRQALLHASAAARRALLVLLVLAEVHGLMRQGRVLSSAGRGQKCSTGSAGMVSTKLGGAAPGDT